MLSFARDSAIQPRAVRDVDRRAHLPGGGGQVHLAQAGTLLRLHAEPLVAPEAGSVTGLVGLPCRRVYDTAAPAVLRRRSPKMSASRTRSCACAVAAHHIAGERSFMHDCKAGRRRLRVFAASAVGPIEYDHRGSGNSEDAAEKLIGHL